MCIQLTFMSFKRYHTFSNVLSGEFMRSLASLCSVVWRVYAKIGLGSPPHDHHCIRHLLLIMGTDNMELRMAFLHACMISVHKLRGPAFAVKRENRERYIMANFKCSVSRDSNLKRLYNQLWS